MIVQKVMITQCHDRRWYKDYVGTEWDIIAEFEIEYMCRAADGYLNFILKKDCEPSVIQYEEKNDNER